MRTLLALGFLLSGCAAARLVEPARVPGTDSAEARLVVLEPFFETAAWTLVTKTEQAQVYGAGPTGVGLTSQPTTEVMIQRQVAEKPLFARVATLQQEHQLALVEVQRLRPSWRVTSTGGLPAVEGSATLVRVVIAGAELAGSDRALKSMLCVWGFFSPIRETQRVHGTLYRYDSDASALRPRLLKYPTQSDFAVDTRGLSVHDQRFGLDLEYEEGLFAPELARDPVLVEGFARVLAQAIVALVEERR